MKWAGDVMRMEEKGNE